MAIREEIQLRSKLYQINEQHSNLNLFFFWQIDRTLLSVMNGIRELKEEVNNEPDNRALQEIQNLEIRIQNSFIYKIKGERIERVIKLQSKDTLENKLEEIFEFISENNINTPKKIKKLQSDKAVLNDLLYSFKLSKQSDKVGEVKKLKAKFKKGEQYWYYLVKANSELDRISTRCFSMNRKTDFYLENKILHYFKMKRLGKYSKIVKRELLTHYDQRENPDLRTKIELKNNKLEELQTKMGNKIYEVKIQLDEELKDLEKYFDDNSTIYPKLFLRQQKLRLFTLKLKYNALGLDHQKTKAKNLVGRINVQLSYIKEQEKS